MIREGLRSVTGPVATQHTDCGRSQDLSLHNTRTAALHNAVFIINRHTAHVSAFIRAIVRDRCLKTEVYTFYEPRPDV